MASHGDSPLSHVVDQPTFEFPYWVSPYVKEIELPSFLGVQLTRFMVTELIASVLIILIVIPLARHVAREPVTRGWFLNLFETFLLFIRDQVARPAIGGHGDHGGEGGHGAHGEHKSHGRHEADAFVPYLWTVFFFILFNNVLGMIPGMASATGNVNVTAVLALLTLGTVMIAGMKVSGPGGFWVAMVPALDVPAVMKKPLFGLMFVIEIVGLFIRHAVLAVRLFANMLAGHIVLSVILGFILMARETGYFWPVAAASVGGVIALSVLELFVAFLQAYIFTFLSALFIGTAVHPH